MDRALKNILKIFSILALFSLALVSGCCDSSSNTTGSSSDKVVLEFWNTMEGREAAVMPDVFKAFKQKYPNITINETTVDFYEAKEKYIKAVSEGKAPDLIRTDRFWLASFVSKGLLSEIKESEITEELSDMVPVARDFVTLDKKIWAIPLSVDSLAMFYNKAHFREKSLPVPTNLDDFSKACKALTDPANNRYGFFIYPNGWYFEPFFFAFGGQYFDADGKLYIKSDAGRKALEYLLHIKAEIKAVPPMPYTNKLYRTMIESFSSGQTSIIFTGPWAIRDIIAGSAFKDNNLNLGVGEIPRGPSGTFSPIGCQSIAISSSTKNRDAALKFAKFMFDYDIQKNFTMANYGLPARRKVFAAPELKQDPYLQTFIKQLQMSCKAYTHPEQGDIYAPLGDKIIKVLNGDLTIEYALTDVETEWKATHH